MKIVFFGSSKYSTIAQEALFKKFGLSLVVTLPDRELGRKKILTPNPVKAFAKKNNIPVIVAEKLDKKIVQKILKQVQNDKKADFFVIADYGLILPKEVLQIPKFSALNIHHSLLPKYRGPSPAPTAILNGDKVSGVTIIKMIEKVDAGPILSQKEYELSKDETTDSLLTKLNQLGGEIIISVIENYSSINPVEQDEHKASFTKRMTKQDGYIDIDNPPSPEILDRMIRAYYPWPGIWTKFRIQNSLASPSEAGRAEFRIKFLPEKRLQIAGGKPMTIKDFLNGYPEAKSILQNIF